MRVPVPDTQARDDVKSAPATRCTPQFVFFFKNLGSIICLRTIDANAFGEITYGAATGMQHSTAGRASQRATAWLFWGSAMRFEIQPIDQETLDSIYTAEIAEQLQNFIYPTRNWSDSSRRRWVVNHLQNAYFFEVSLADRLDWAFGYVFIQNGEFALVRTVGDGLYAVVTASAGMAARLERAKCQIAEALRVGGVFLDGQYDLPSEFGVNLPNINAVPNAQFVPYSPTRQIDHAAIPGCPPDDAFGLNDSQLSNLTSMEKTNG
jgi:hypothetical protein